MSSKMVLTPMRIIILLLMIQMLLSVTGCGSLTSAGQSIRDSVNFDLTSQPEIILDNWVNTSPVQIYVYPTTPPPSPPKALFIPFRMTQQIENFLTVGRNISHIVWQNWLQNEVFSTLEFLRSDITYRPDIALSIAEQKGADLVVGGYVTDFIDGGTRGDTRVSLAIEIYEVKTGNLLWSMAVAGTMQASKVNDYILFATRIRMPTNPSSAVITVLSEKMGEKVKKWISPSIKNVPWHLPAQ